MRFRANSGRRRGRRWAAGSAVLLVLAVAGCGGGDDETSDATPKVPSATPAQLTADSEAQTAARLTSTALETYAVDHNGSYAGATIPKLRQIEPVIPKNVRVETSASAYTIHAPSSLGGNEFSILRTNSGIDLTCKKPGTGACSTEGIW